MSGWRPEQIGLGGKDFLTLGLGGTVRTLTDVAHATFAQTKSSARSQVFLSCFPALLPLVYLLAPEPSSLPFPA